MNAINLVEKLATFAEYWQPRTVGQFNGHDLMVVKVKGEFVWHRHGDTDDFFLVLKGRVTIQMRDQNVALGPGELFVVPGGSSIVPLQRKKRIFFSSNQRGRPIPATLRPLLVDW